MRDYLDNRDRKILAELDLNGRIPESAIAKKLKLSQEVVGYRIKKLQMNNFVPHFSTLINAMQLGYMDFRIFFKFTNISSDLEQEIVAYFTPKVNWCAKIAGKYDMGVMIFVKDVSEFEKFLDETMQRFGNAIDNYWVSIMTKIIHFKKGYLLNKKTEDFLVMERKTKSAEVIDEIDHKILSLIIDDARMKNVDIGKALCIGEKLVRDRVKRMEKKNIILGYSPFINISKMSLTHYKIFFQIKNAKPEQLKAIETYALYNPKIVFIVKAIGATDIEIEAQVKNNVELYAIIDEIRTRFYDIIKDWFFVEYITEYKLNFLPKFQTEFSRKEERLRK